MLPVVGAATGAELPYSRGGVMNPSIRSIEWPAPAGLFIPEHELVVDREPALLALRGGRCKTGPNIVILFSR